MLVNMGKNIKIINFPIILSILATLYGNVVAVLMSTTSSPLLINNKKINKKDITKQMVFMYYCVKNIKIIRNISIYNI